MGRLFFAFGLFVIGAILLSGCTSSSAEKSGDTAQPTSTQNANPTYAAATPQTTQPVQEVPSELNLKIGESATVNFAGGNKKLQVTVLSGSTRREYEYTSSFMQEPLNVPAKAGKVFYIFNVEVKNSGTTDAYFIISDFALIGSDGTKYDADLYLGDDALKIVGSLNAGTKQSGKILFEVPETIDKLKLVYNFGNVFDAKTKLVTWNFDKDDLTGK